MRHSYVGACVFAAAVLVSCGNATERSSDTANSSVDTPSVTTPNDQSVLETPPTGGSTTVTDPTAAPSDAPSSATATGAVNPPHGQPGHTCDIPVGAPMSTKPTKNTPSSDAGGQSPVVVGSPTGSTPPIGAKPPTGATPPISGSTPSPSTSGTMGRLNPPHGQPGHSCDVKVGQPLPNK